MHSSIFITSFGFVFYMMSNLKAEQIFFQFLQIIKPEMSWDLKEENQLDYNVKIEWSLQMLQKQLKAIVQSDKSIEVNKMSTNHINHKPDIKPDEQDRKEYYFLFVNRKSGSRAGRQLLGSKESDLSYNHSTKIIHFITIDLYKKEQVNSAFERAHELIEQEKTVRIIICGGDGTIQWVLEQAIRYGADFDRIVFGVLPIGTGNDFAESVGFKTYCYNGKATQLEDIAVAFSQCDVGYYDIWECVVECQNDGKITQIKNGTQVPHEEKRLVRNFTNYFGLGTDARICYIAQKLNAKNIFMKKVAYGFAGFLSFFLQWGTLSSKISIKQKKQNQVIEQIDQTTLKVQTDQEETIENVDLDEQEYEPLKIGPFDQCMAFLNSTSSMELGHVWQTPYLIQKNPPAIRKEYTEQRVNDGKIELVSYTNQLSVLFERCFHMAKRVSQGRGPFKIIFKKPNPNESNYIHINGQPYKIQGLRSIVIEPSVKFPNGKIRILSRKH